MSIFFILSGFSISYNYLNSNEWNYHSTCQFYVKRLIQIIPTYLLIHILWLFFGKESFVRWLFLTPLELSALQSMYPNILGLLHNGGTWFISCLLISYFIYPILRCIFHNSQPKTIYISIICIIAALIYFPFVGEYYALGGGIYTNPVIRALEFTLGVLTNYSAFFINHDQDLERNSLSANVLGFGFSVLMCAVLLCFRLHDVVIGYQKYVLPVSALLLYPILIIILHICYFSRSRRLESNSMLKYFSGLIYYFFLLQLVLWPITDAVFSSVLNITGIDLKTNSTKILLSFSICLILSIAISKLIDAPIEKLCFSKLSVFRS